MFRTGSMTLILCLSAGAATAQVAERPNAAPAIETTIQTSADKDAQDPRALRLTLEEAISTAAKRNLGVEIQELEYESTGYVARSTYGLLDTYFSGYFATESSESPVITAVDASKRDVDTFNFGMRRQFSTGGVLQVGFNNFRQDSNSAFAEVNPAFSSNLGLDFRQPLLRNFGVDITRRPINIARNNLGISKEQFRSVLMDTIVQVETAYLDLVYARENLDVLQQSLSLASDQERITRIRIDVGASAPLDILQPQVAIRTREEEVISGEARVRDAEDRLRQLLNMPPSEWDRPIIPSTAVVFAPISVDLQDSVTRAWAIRPEVRQAELGIENREIDFAYRKNQVLPSVDLAVEYGYAGLGAGSDSGFGDAYERIVDLDFPGWTLGFQVGVPLHNTEAKALRKSAELDLVQSRTTLEQTRFNIAVQVRSAVRDLETLSRQIVATRAAREAAEQNVDAERKRFENGLTTNFNVLQIQQELSSARSRELAALVGYQQAVAQYHRAVGDLLAVREITVDVPDLSAFDLPTSDLESTDWLTYSGYVDDLAAEPGGVEVEIDGIDVPRPDAD